MTNADVKPWLNAIHQGDILKLLPELPDASVDLVIASPPYNLLNSTGNGSRCWDGYDGHSDNMPHHAYVEWQRLCLAQMLRVLTPDGAIFYNHMHRVQNGLIVRHDDILQDFPLRQVIIWHRSGGTNFNPGYFLPDYEVVYLIAKPKFRLLEGHTDGSVWRIHQEQHSWIPEIPTFPVDLPRRAIRATSAKVVLDPFMGSGTTAVAAVLEGRSYIGIEQSARYCAIARERLAGLDPANGTPSLPMPPRPLFDVSDLPCRGSSRSVFRYICDVVTNNGSRPKVIDQSDIAEHLQVDLRTVQRAVRSLKVCGAIKLTNHGQWSSYELTSPPRTVVTADDNPSQNVATNNKKSPRTVVTDADNPSQNVATNDKKSPRTVVTSALPTLGTAPGPGPGGIQGSDLDVQNGVNDPGPGPGKPHCPEHPGQHAIRFHQGDRVFWCRVAGCSWIASEDLGDIIPPGQEPIKHYQLAAVYHEKQYSPRKWARRYYGTQQRAA